MLKFILIFSSVLMIVLGFTFIAMFNYEKRSKKRLGYYDMSMLKKETGRQEFSSYKGYGINIYRGGDILNRSTTRLNDKVYYAQGQYAPTTLCAEMETSEIRECMHKLAIYEDLDEKISKNLSYDTFKNVLNMLSNENHLVAKRVLKSNFDIDITDANGDFRPTFDILNELSVILGSAEKEM